MQFKEVVGQDEVKLRLIQSYQEQRLSHAQLLFGAEGSGVLPLALAFAQYITCENSTHEDSCGVCSSCVKNAKMIHPDVHYSFPVATVRDNKNPKSTDFVKDFRRLVLQNPYLHLNDWLDELKTENKQGFMSVEESADINRKLSLKSFESEYRILIMWLPEKMRTDAANKLLKIIEEPPPKTIFLLATENQDQLLPTILSRLQRIKVKRISDLEIQHALQSKYQLDTERAHSIAHISEGNYYAAQTMAEQDADSEVFVTQFLVWMRLCFSPNKSMPHLLAWVDERSKTSREQQKSFLHCCIQTVRECMITQLNEPELVRWDDKQISTLQDFVRFITPSNIEEMVHQLNQACYHTERQANAKILFLNLSLRVHQLLQQKTIEV